MVKGLNEAIRQYLCFNGCFDIGAFHEISISNFIGIEEIVLS
jgi:hypothetical protein